MKLKVVGGTHIYSYSWFSAPVPDQDEQVGWSWSRRELCSLLCGTQGRSPHTCDDTWVIQGIQTQNSVVSWVIVNFMITRQKKFPKSGLSFKATFYHWDPESRSECKLSFLRSNTVKQHCIFHPYPSFLLSLGPFLILMAQNRPPRHQIAAKLFEQRWLQFRKCLQIK